jgi:glyoxylase-like metal-dependent hydrolase (beta-lactamase superfamily II)
MANRYQSPLQRMRFQLRMAYKVLIAAGLLAGWLIYGQQAGAQMLPPGIPQTETITLADGLYSYRDGPYRSLFMVTSEGVIATDPVSPEFAQGYRAAIAELTNLPVKYVVYSHAHWDHSRGGQIFKAEGATFVSQERCVDNWLASPAPDVIMPDITFKDAYKVELGGQSLDLHYFGPSHGTCLIVMVPRPHKMILTVDTVTPRPAGGGYLPWDPQSADMQFYNIVQSLQAVEQFAIEQGIDTIIGAHLVPLPLGKGKFEGAAVTGPIIQIRERWQFWDGLFKAVEAEMAAGTESYLVSSQLDLSPWEDIRGFNKRKFKILVDRVAAYYAIGK